MLSYIFKTIINMVGKQNLKFCFLMHFFIQMINNWLFKYTILTDLYVLKFFWEFYVSAFFEIFYFVLLQLLQFFPLSLSSPSPSHPLWAIPQLLFFIRVHGSCVWVLWLLYFLYCTLHPCSYSVTTNFHFLIPSPLHPFPHTPSHLIAIKMLSISRSLSLFSSFA